MFSFTSSHLPVKVVSLHHGHLVSSLEDNTCLLGFKLSNLNLALPVGLHAPIHLSLVLLLHEGKWVLHVLGLLHKSELLLVEVLRLLDNITS